MIGVHSLPYISSRITTDSPKRSIGFHFAEIEPDTTAARIREYLDGEVESIPELEEEVLSYDGSAPAEGQSPYLCLHNVRGVATPGLML